MTTHRLAGQPAPPDLLVNVEQLRGEYAVRRPDPSDRAQRVSFGTSGHRGSSLNGQFTESHVLAITQAICDYRVRHGISGPLFIGKDTHALSDSAFVTALEVLAANGVDTMIDAGDGYTPTPAISLAILTHNAAHASHQAHRRVSRRDRDHPIPQSAGGWGVQVQPADRWTCRGRRHALDRRTSQPAARGRPASGPTHRLRRRPRRGDNPSLQLPDGLRARARHSRRHGCNRRRRPEDRRRSARRCQRRLLGPDCRSIPPRRERGERHRRSHVPLHAPRLGRPHPHGLLVPVRDGDPDSAPGALRRRGRGRPGQRPARHRDAKRRPDESESLPCRRDLVSLHTSPGLAGGRRRREDRGVEQPDRSRRQTRPGARSWKCRSASSGSSRAF